jgi:hypothetical protein
MIERHGSRGRVRRGVTGALVAAACLLAARGATAQTVDTTRTDNLPTGKGQLSLESITLRLTAGNLEISFVPLDERVLRLLQRDTYQGIERMLASEQTQIDSAARANGVTDPGVALVSFHGLAPNTRFDPSLLTVVFHGQQFRPEAWVPLSATFSNQRLDIRQQVQALFIYRRDIPVQEQFSVSYLGSSTDDWQRRLPNFDLERTRIGTVHATPDTSHQR